MALFGNKKKEKVELKHWYRDRYQYVVVQRKMLVFITLAALLCALVTMISIAQMTPLKSVEPFVIQIDQKSGIVQTVDPRAFGDVANRDSVNNYFIVQYLRAREGYDPANLIYNYNLVRIMSAPKNVYQAFLKEADPNNPQSNVARLGNTLSRRVKVKSITPLKPQTSQVRFTIEETGDGHNAQFHKIATIDFEYIKMELGGDDRYLNPLGFRITGYRVDEEVFTP